jgi:5-amino-6-(5-phosphoribosylamino)uracil reductase
VTVTGSGSLAPSARFFAAGGDPPLVYCASGTVAPTRARLQDLAVVLDGGEPVDLRRVGEDLYERGVRRLMVEGGTQVHTQFLTGDLADELQLVVAPFFVGDPGASRFVGPGGFPFHRHRRAPLARVDRLDDVVLLTYALSPRFHAAEPEENR